MSKSFTWETIVNSSCKKCYQTISDPKKYQKIIPGPMEISKVTKTDIGWQWVMEGKAPMLGDTEIKIISETTLAEPPTRYAFKTSTPLDGTLLVEYTFTEIDSLKTKITNKSTISIPGMKGILVEKMLASQIEKQNPKIIEKFSKIFN